MLCPEWTRFVTRSSTPLSRCFCQLRTDEPCWEFERLPGCLCAFCLAHHKRVSRSAIVGSSCNIGQYANCQQCLKGFLGAFRIAHFSWLGSLLAFLRCRELTDSGACRSKPDPVYGSDPSSLTVISGCQRDISSGCYRCSRWSAHAFHSNRVCHKNNDPTYSDFFFVL